MGVDVNWAEFAFTQTHTHERHCPLPRLLQEFECLMEPLAPLKKVIPIENFTDPVHSMTTMVELGPTLHSLPAHPASGIPSKRNEPSSSTPIEDTKTFFMYSILPLPSLGSMDNKEAFPSMEDAALSALKALKGPVHTIVDGEQMRLRTARHEAYGPVANISQHLEEEKELLKHVNMKLTENKDSFNRAVEEYEKSRSFLTIARGDPLSLLPSDGSDRVKENPNLFESLVVSCSKIVDIARKQVGVWEFKSQRQYMIVEKLALDLSTAEAKYGEVCLEIDSEVDKLRALLIFLNRL
ncbi:hypothetical protein KC19_VG334300 [Ceratodon purpureus]|uniref:Uncharacterized protein n=1 Tax=Ceratodon purpureus TaxID=3225 RepID=A0A8T0HWZ8_CERPU|nr:hypothetical protein KC19_VG334300 [Ceratodon purpureus]